MKNYVFFYQLIKGERSNDQNVLSRTQRIQRTYARLRSTMMTYYQQLNIALPLLLMSSSGRDNERLRDVMPVLLNTLNGFRQGGQVYII